LHNQLSYERMRQFSRREGLVEDNASNMNAALQQLPSVT